MYASLWDKDCQAKCKREEMEAAMQVERNKEMLQVLTLQSASIEQQKEDMRKLREKEAQLLVSDQCINTFFLGGGGGIKPQVLKLYINAK